MKQQLEAIRKAALDAISNAGKAEDLEALRVRYLGKKGELTAVLKQMCAPSSRRAWRRARRSWPQKRWR